MAEILLIDDDAFVQDYISRLLRGEGHAPSCAASAAGGLAACQRRLPDLVLLDPGLPDDQGFGLCERLRALDPLLPILIVSARHRLQDRLAGLRAGADDYLLKPFEREELLARIEVQLRRQAAYGRVRTALAPQAPLQFPGIALVAESRTARIGAQSLRLSKTEFRLLETLCRQPDRVLTREYLLSEVWQIREGSTRTVDNHVMRLRRKLAEAVGAAGQQHPLLDTVYGIGYCLRTRPEAPEASGAAIDIPEVSDYAQAQER